MGHPCPELVVLSSGLRNQDSLSYARTRISVLALSVDSRSLTMVCVNWHECRPRANDDGRASRSDIYPSFDPHVSTSVSTWAS